MQNSDTNALRQKNKLTIIDPTNEEPAQQVASKHFVTREFIIMIKETMDQVQAKKDMLQSKKEELRNLIEYRKVRNFELKCYDNQNFNLGQNKLRSSEIVKCDNDEEGESKFRT